MKKRTFGHPLMPRARGLAGPFFHRWAPGSALVYGTGNYLGSVGGHGLRVIGGVSATTIEGSTAPILRTFTVEATNEDGDQVPWAIAESTSWISVSPDNNTGLTIPVQASTVDLTAEGTSDWVHWGLNSASAVNRKVGGVPQIGTLTGVGGTPGWVTGGALRIGVTWSDGTPTVSATTKTMLFIAGDGNGYELTVPADTSQRTLVVYLGGFQSRGEIEVSISDGSAPVFRQTVEDLSSGFDRRFALTYSAGSAGQTLTLRYIQVQGTAGGNINFRAAVLQEGSAPGSALLTPTQRTITATIDPTGLAAGAYTGDLTITAIGAQGSPKTLTARLSVFSQPVISLSTVSLDFGSYLPDDPIPAPQTVVVSDGSAFPGAPFTFTVSDDQPWVSTLKVGDTVAVYVDPSLAPSGQLTATVTITSPEAVNSPQTVSISWAVAPNAVVLENQLTADTFYLLSDLGDTANQGFTTAFSVNAGSTVNFKVHGDSQQIEIFRFGHYSGGLYKKKATIANTPTIQPAAQVIADTNGATTCSNWAVTASWDVPADAVSGFYCAVVRNAALNAHSHIIFLVRNDSRAADIVVKLSDSTWGAAYNTFGAMDNVLGGKSIYGTGPGVDLGGNITTRSLQVSYDRPLNTLGQVVNHPYDYEMALISYLEEQGYNVKYIGCYDLDVGTARVGAAKVLLCAGHDEYWSDNMRNNAEALRNQGTHLVFMSANDIFWRIRYKSLGRIVECYKDTMDGPGLHVGGVEFDPLGWTGTWRDTRWANRRPENLTLATTFRMNGIVHYAATILNADYGFVPLWRDTAVASADTTITGLIGFEANSVDIPANKLAGVLAGHTINIDGRYADDNGQVYTGNGDLNWGIVAHREQVSHGVTVSFGTIDWITALSNNHLGYQSPANVNCRQATINLLQDLGVSAKTLSVGLTAPTPVPLNYYGVGDVSLPNVTTLYPAFDYFADYQDAWVLATVYALGEVVLHRLRTFVCDVGHTANAAREPGVGANWEDNWTEVNPVLRPPLPATIDVSATSLNFSSLPDVAPDSQTITLSNTGELDLNWTISDDAAWLTVTPVSGTNGAVLTVSCAAQSVENTYNGVITISAPGATNTPVAINVSYQVATITAQNLYPANPTPEIITPGADPANYTFGCTFTAAVNGQVTGVKFYRPPGDAGPCSIGLYNESGQLAVAPLLASKTGIDTSAGGWIEALFDIPVQYTAGVNAYVACFNMGTNQGYGRMSNLFATSLVVDDLTAPGAAFLNNIFTTGTTLAPPSNSFNQNGYCVSPIFEPD